MSVPMNLCPMEMAPAFAGPSPSSGFLTKGLLMDKNNENVRDCHDIMAQDRATVISSLSDQAADGGRSGFQRPANPAAFSGAAAGSLNR